MLREAEKLVKAGVKELLVISQDTSAYGLDLRYAESRWRERDVAARFLDLTRELGSLGAWVRLHYVYPYPHVDEVVALMNGGNRCCPISTCRSSTPRRRCSRRCAGRAIRRRRWSASAPGARSAPTSTIRSTFIVGFPGETEEDFRLLLDWLDEAKLDRVGAFKYEPVAGARANDLGLDAVPDEIKQSRWKRFMERQQAISAKKLAAKVGKRLEVIIDEGGAASPRAAPRATRPRSTAPCTSRRAGRCAPATSSGEDRARRRLRFVGNARLGRRRLTARRRPTTAATTCPSMPLNP